MLSHRAEVLLLFYLYVGQSMRANIYLINVLVKKYKRCLYSWENMKMHVLH